MKKIFFGLIPLLLLAGCIQKKQLKAQLTSTAQQPTSDKKLTKKQRKRKLMATLADSAKQSKLYACGAALLTGIGIAGISSDSSVGRVAGAVATTGAVASTAAAMYHSEYKPAAAVSDYYNQDCDDSDCEALSIHIENSKIGVTSTQIN